MDKRSDKRNLYLIAFLLVLATLTVYWPVLTHDFINYDDQVYVTENKHVQAGITWESLRWIFSGQTANPLTWISHMLDCTLFGLRPWGHHLTSLIFHTVNTLLLFIVLRRSTGAVWQSTFVAAMFALHPLHVEAVAWVSSRKDLLSTFFWMLTMLAYIRYVEKPSAKRYWMILLALALGLMSKSMLVTLPFVLLLMDYWPLKRIELPQIEKEVRSMFGQGPKIRYRESVMVRLFVEKIPLIFLVLISGVITYLVQEKIGAVPSFEVLPLGTRFLNALTSYSTYLVKTVWPSGLAIFYPYAGENLYSWKTLGSLFLLMGLTLFAFRSLRRQPYLAVGWIWFIVTLIPVIGIVQVGMHSMADRYTYVPLIGIFSMIAWGIPERATRWRLPKQVPVLGGIALLSVFAVLSWMQLQNWRNTTTVFQHAVAVTSNNWLAHQNLGINLASRGQIAEAVAHYKEVLRIKPNFADAHINLAKLLAEEGKLTEAIEHYSAASQARREDENLQFDLGILLRRVDNDAEAIKHFSEALRINPQHARAYFQLGLIYDEEGKISEAIAHYSEAVRHKRGYADAATNLAVCLSKIGKLEEATAHLSEALEFNPDSPDLHNNLGIILAKQGKNAEAEFHFSEVIRLSPNHWSARYNLGLLLARQGKIDTAIQQYSEALRIKPNYVEARRELEKALQLQK